MGHMTLATIERFDQVQRATDAVLGYDVEEKIQTAQMEMEFEEGIKVANEVTAELIADLHHLFDYHGQDWDGLLAAAAAKYEEHVSQAAEKVGAVESGS